MFKRIMTPQFFILRGRIFNTNIKKLRPVSFQLQGCYIQGKPGKLMENMKNSINLVTSQEMFTRNQN